MNHDEQIEEEDNLKEDSDNFKDSKKHELKASPEVTEKSTVQRNLFCDRWTYLKEVLFKAVGNSFAGRLIGSLITL
jgi:hypothetical protein